MDDLKFKDPPNTAVITTKNIINRSGWIGYVSHDSEDGAWQFLEGNTGLDPKEAALLSLKEMLEMDPSVIELADLPLGWHAWRSIKGAKWILKEK